MPLFRMLVRVNKQPLSLKAYQLPQSILLSRQKNPTFHRAPLEKKAHIATNASGTIAYANIYLPLKLSTRYFSTSSEQSNNDKKSIFSRFFPIKLPIKLESHTSQQPISVPVKLELKTSQQLIGVPIKLEPQVLREPISIPIKLEPHTSQESTKNDHDKDTWQKKYCLIKTDFDKWKWEKVIWPLIKFGVLPAIAFLVAQFVEQRFKERSENLKTIGEIKTHVNNHQKDAREVLGKLDSLEIVPRLGVYSTILPDEYERHQNIEINLLQQLNYNLLLQGRLNRIRVLLRDTNFFSKLLPTIGFDHKPINWFMTEVDSQVGFLLAELEIQRDELFIAYQMNKATMHFKLKQHVLAIEEINQVIEKCKILNKFSEEDNKKSANIDGNTKNNQKRLKPVYDQNFIIRALVHAYVIAGKAYYGKIGQSERDDNYLNALKAFNSILELANSDFRVVDKDNKECFSTGNKSEQPKNQSYYFALSAEPLALCYSGLTFSAKKKHNEAVLCLIESLLKAPDIATLDDGFAYTVSLLSQQIDDNIRGGKAHVFESYKTALNKLHFEEEAFIGENLKKLPYELNKLAFEKLNRAIATKPSSPPLLNHRGWVLLAIAKDTNNVQLTSDALDDFNHAIENDMNPRKTYPLARAGRGIALYRLYKAGKKQQGECLEDLIIADTFLRKTPEISTSRSYGTGFIQNEVKKTLDELKRQSAPDSISFFRIPPQLEKQKQNDSGNHKEEKINKTPSSKH